MEMTNGSLISDFVCKMKKLWLLVEKKKYLYTCDFRAQERGTPVQLSTAHPTDSTHTEIDQTFKSQSNAAERKWAVVSAALQQSSYQLGRDIMYHCQDKTYPKLNTI